MAEQSIFNREAFNNSLKILKKLADSHEKLNNEALELHNRAFREKWDAIPDDIPDVAPVTNSEIVGSAILELIRTIPGVSTDKEMAELLKKPSSIALSDRAVSVLLKESKDGSESGFCISFATPNWPKHTIQFDKTGADKSFFSIDIMIGEDTLPLNGKIKIGTRDGQCVTVRQTIDFDSKGVLSGDNSEFGLKKGDTVDVTGIIQYITSSKIPNKTLDASIPKLSKPTI